MDGEYRMFRRDMAPRLQASNMFYVDSEIYISWRLSVCPSVRQHCLYLCYH